MLQEIGRNGKSGAHLDGDGMGIKRCDMRQYPSELDDDLKGVDLPRDVIEEALVCSWQYARCVIPNYTNWDRYLNFIRIVVVGVSKEPSSQSWAWFGIFI